MSSGSSGTTCGSLKSGTHSGYLIKKGGGESGEDIARFYKTKGSDPHLYCYASENQTFRPLEKVNMSKATVLTDFGMDPPALVIESLELKWVLQTAEENELLPWLQAMEGCGVHCLEPQESICKAAANASNIYCFQVKDINGNMIELDKYKENVTLIVNVASE